MMRLTFTNQQLPQMITLLESLELPPTPSRARTHLSVMLQPALETFATDEYQLVSAYAKLDQSGKPAVNTDGTITIATPAKEAEFRTEHNTLLAETVTVEFADDKAHRLLTALGATSQTFTGHSATALDTLMSALEQNQETP